MQMLTSTDSWRGAVRKFALMSWRPIALVFALALLMRVATAFVLPAEVIWEDGYRYDHVADNLLSGHGFGNVWENRLSVPTQPLLIAAVKLVFGNNYFVLRLFFALLGAATCAVAWILARRLFDPVTALFAGVMLALYPYHVYLSALFEYPQAFFMLMTGIAFVLLYQFRNKQQKPALFLAGLSLGIAVLSVPTVLLCLPLLALTLWSGRVGETLTSAVILLVAAGIPVGCWALRNYVAYDELILVNQAAGMNFWVANNETYYRFGKTAVIPPCAIGFENTSFCRESLALDRAMRDSGLKDTAMVSAIEKAGWDYGWKFIRESPARSLELSVRKFLTYWSPFPDAVSRGGAFGGPMRDVVSIGSYAPVLLLALVGMWQSRHAWQRFLPVGAFFLTFVGSYCIFLPTTRYRLPLDFFLVLFAAFALGRLLRVNNTDAVR